MRVLLLAALAATAACSDPGGARAPTTTAAFRVPPIDGVDAEDAVLALLAERSRVVAATPEDGKAWLRLGSAYDAHRLYHRAAECYAAATHLAPEDPKAWYHLARASAEVGELDTALRAVERSLALAPDHAPSHWRRGFWLLDLGRPEDARAAFLRATEILPDDDAGHVGLARTALELGDGATAATGLEAVLARHPDNGYARQLLGTAYRLLGRDADAERELLRSRLAYPTWTDAWKLEVEAEDVRLLHRLDLLRERVRDGRGAEVIAELEVLLAAHPAHIAILSTLTPAYVQTEDIDTAIAVNERALETRPDHARIHLNLALLYPRRGDPERGLAHATRATELNPAAADAHAQRGRLLLAASHFEEAERALSLALRQGNEQAPVLVAVAEARIALGRWSDAASALERALSLTSASAPAALLARVRIELARTTDARRAWREATRRGHDAAELEVLEADIRRLERAAAEGGGGA